MNPTKTTLSISLAGGSLALMVLLSACGGSSVISASAVAKCAHASRQSDASLEPHTRTLHEIVAKVVSGGWLLQTYSDRTEAESRAGTPSMELYVFPSNQIAEEAFKIITAAPNAKEEWGGGGTFRRGNVIATASDQGSGSLITVAETLLSKCVGAGASQSIVRPEEEMIDGRPRSEIERAGEDGDVPLPSTTGEDQAAPETTQETTQEPAQEPPASEDRTNPGSSPVPGEGG